MGDEIMKFFKDYWPENPNTLVKHGKDVPFLYLIHYMHEYGCNNWRRRNGLPVWRKRWLKRLI